MAMEPIRRIGPRTNIAPVSRVEGRKKGEDEDAQDRGGGPKKPPAPRRRPPEEGEHLIDVEA